MAVESGTLGTVTVGANTVAATTAWTLDRSVVKIPAHSSGSGLSTDLAGRAMTTGTINCWLDQADATGQGAMVPGGTVSLVLYPQGPGSGNAKRSFSAIIEAMNEAGGVDDTDSRSFTYWSNEAVDETPDP